MKHIILIVSAITLLGFASCSNGTASGDATSKDSLGQGQLSREQLLDSIGKEEKRLKGSTTYDPHDAMGVMRLYVDFANRFPQDTMTAEYLFRASDIAQGMGNYTQAAEYLETILDKHTGYRKYEDACFAAALTYDNYLENVNNGKDRAVELYNFVIEKYPNSYYAEQAKVLKEYVGKPDSVYYNDLREKMKANEGK